MNDFDDPNDEGGEPERPAEKAARHAKKAVRAAKKARDDEAAMPDDDLSTDIQSLFEGLPSEADLRLYRKAKTGGKLEYCESFAEPRDFSEQAVADRWGPGSYRLFARVPDPRTGKLQFTKGRSRVFNIAERPGGNQPNAPRHDDSAMLQFSTAMVGQLQMMQQMMLQGQESHRAMLAVMMQPRPDTSMEMMKVLLPVMFAQKADPMEMALKMAELIKGQTGPAASIADNLSALEQLLKVANRMGGSDGADDGPAWLQGLKTTVPLIQQLMMPRPQEPNAPAAPPAPRPRPLPNPSEPARELPPPVDTPDPPVSAHPLLTLLDETMPWLVRAAGRNGDARTSADWFLEQVPDDQVEGLAAFLEDASVVDQLGIRYPATVTYRPWFVGLIEEIKAGLEPEGEDDDATPTESVGGGESEPDDGTGDLGNR